MAELRPDAAKCCKTVNTGQECDNIRDNPNNGATPGPTEY